MTSLGNAVQNVSAYLTNTIGVNTYNSAATAINYFADKVDVASNYGAAAAMTDVMDDVNQTVDNFTTPISGADVVEGLTNVENWEGAATAVFGAYLGSGAFSGKSSSSTALSGGVRSADNVAVSSTRGAANPKVAEALKIGKEAHKDFSLRAESKGWSTNVKMTDPQTGKPVVADIVTKGGHPLELKPNTFSGAAKGAKQLPQYERGTGNNGRVIYYDPEKYRK